MKRIIIFFMSFSFFNLQAQPSAKSKILIGYNFSLDYNFRTLKNNNSNPMSDYTIKSRNEMEIAKFGYTTGVCISFSVKKNISVESGIQYSNNGYKTEKIYLSPPFIPDPAYPSNIKFIYNYRYLGIPIKAKLYFGKKDFKLFSGIGVLSNFLLSANTTSIKEFPNGNKENKTQASYSDYRKINFLPIVSVGVDLKLIRDIHLQAEPTFRYSLLNTKDAPITEHLWNLGLNIVLYGGIK